MKEFVNLTTLKTRSELFLAIIEECENKELKDILELRQEIEISFNNLKSEFEPFFNNLNMIENNSKTKE